MNSHICFETSHVAPVNDMISDDADIISPGYRVEDVKNMLSDRYICKYSTILMSGHLISSPPGADVEERARALTRS